MGNISQLTEYAPNAATATFQYDSLDRLTNASGAYSAQYAYDLIGDLTSKAEAGATRDPVYTLTTRPKHAPKTVDGITQTYDANGNLIHDGSRAFIFDDENRLATVIYDATTMQFVYDPDGKRIKKTENGQTTVYIGKHYEKSLSTGQVTKYYEALGQAVAVSVNGATTYLYRDHLGSTVATSGSATRNYWPYGSTRSSSGANPSDRLYTGQLWNNSVGLHYYGARFYDPPTGRFIAADTIVPPPGNPQALNRYSYTLNNPMKFVDATGHGCFIPFLIAALLTGAGASMAPTTANAPSPLEADVVASAHELSSLKSMACRTGSRPPRCTISSRKSTISTVLCSRLSSASTTLIWTDVTLTPSATGLLSEQGRDR